MKQHFVILFFLIFPLLTFSQTKQTVTKSTITFEIKNLGINTGGSFGGLKADIKFDPAHLDASSIEATIETKTINTDNDTRDSHLKSDSYFDAEKYPQIRMKSISFKHKGGDNYSGIFNLSIRDKTNQVEVPFTYTETGNAGSFKGILKIKRTDYGVGSKSMVMSNDVTITIDVTASK